LAQLKKDLSDNKSFLGEVQSQCEKKAKVHDQRSEARGEELTALYGAIKELKAEGGQSYGAVADQMAVAAEKKMKEGKGNFIQEEDMEDDVSDENVDSEEDADDAETRDEEAEMDKMDDDDDEDSVDSEEPKCEDHCEEDCRKWAPCHGDNVPDNFEIDGETCGSEEDVQCMDDCGGCGWDAEAPIVVNAGNTDDDDKQEGDNKKPVVNDGMKNKNLLQVSASSFLQKRITKQSNRLVKFLKNRAYKLHSSILMSLSTEAVAVESKDVFVKVRGLIKDMIVRLKDQSKAEATQKAVCDKAMKEAVKDRDDANSGMQKDTANIERCQARIAELKKEILETGQEIADTKKEKKEATENYNAEKKQNKASRATSQEGLDSIKTAIRTLKKFYGSKGKSGFIQQPIKDSEGNDVEDVMPDAEDEEYRGSGEASTGIFGLLDVISTDYRRTRDELDATMEDNEKEYNTFVEKADKHIKELVKTKKEAEQDKIDQENELGDNQTNLGSHQKLYKATVKELEENLKPMCVDNEVSHEEKVKRREQEVESLKEALQILRDIGSE